MVDVMLANRVPGFQSEREFFSFGIFSDITNFRLEFALQTNWVKLFILLLDLRFKSLHAKYCFI